MNVSQLIELLSTVEDKNKPVTFADYAEIVLVYEFADVIVLTDSDSE